MRARIGALAAAVACVAALGAGLPGAAGTWVIQPTPNVANVDDNELVSVSCPGATCVAVGDYTLVSRDDRPLAEVWNGTRWTIRRAAVPPGSSSYLTSVSCPAAGDCIAVGANNSNTSAAVPVAEAWNGTQWSLQAIPAPPGSSSLSGVSCAAPDACTAVGLDLDAGAYTPFAERWNGTAWAIQAVPAPSGGESGFNAVSCPTAGTCFAVGAGTDASTGNAVPLAEKWDGTRWAIQPTPQPASAFIAFLRGVSCRGTGGCTAVGTYYAGAAERIMIDRLRDGRWNVQRAPNLPPGYPTDFLQAVSCAAAAGCTVAGTAEDASIGQSVTLVLQRDHGAWVVEPTPNPAGGNPSLTGLSCSAGGCTAVGNNILPGDAGTLTTLAEHN